MAGGLFFCPNQHDYAQRNRRLVLSDQGGGKRRAGTNINLAAHKTGIGSVVTRSKILGLAPSLPAARPRSGGFLLAPNHIRPLGQAPSQLARPLHE
jgi:hypothetical protein